MKQMHTRYMQLGRTEVCAPFARNENKFACQTNMFRRAISSINCLFTNIAWKLEINNILRKLTGALLTVYTNVFF